MTDRPRSNRRFRVLAALFPGPVREAHGRELQQVWQAQHRAAGAATRARARFWFGAIVDVLRVAPRQHVEEFRHDLRYALRALRRTPGFATAAVLTLALGIGATSAVFMVIDAVLLRPLPYRDPSSVALVWAVGKTGERTWLSWPELDDIARRSTRLEGIAGLTDLRMVLTGNGAPQELQALGVSASLFPLLGVHAQLGRLFDVRDDRDGAGRAVLLSDGFWRSRFGAQSSVLGSAVILDGQAYTIAGVLPTAFSIPQPSSVFPRRVDVWVALQPHLVSRARDVRMLHAVARVGQGVSFRQAADEVAAIGAQVSREFAPAYRSGPIRFDVVPLASDVLRGVRPALLAIAGVVALVLAIACTNVASLLLARAETRRREVAIRTSLGASRARIARQLLTEGLVLSALGGACGLAIAGAAPLLAALPPLSRLPRFAEVAYNWRLVAFTAVVSIATALVFTLAPALELSATGVGDADVLRQPGRGRRAARAGRLLSIAEIGLASAAVVVALALAQTLVRALEHDPGFVPAHVLSARLSLAPADRHADAIPPYVDRILEAVRAVPGVTSAAAVTQMPFSGAMLGSAFTPDPAPDSIRPVDADLRGITPDYFSTMQVGLVGGRMFDSHDTREAPQVAIVDETLARRLWPLGDAVGSRMRWIRQPEVPIEIVGIVRAVRHRGLEEDPRETVYRPHAQYPRTTMYVAVRVAGETAAWTDAVTAAVHRVDSRQVVADVTTLEALERQSIAQPGLGAFVGGLLGTLALVMAAIGVYGLFAFAVSQRRREIAVRLALGATRRSILALIAGEAARVVACGLALGLPLSVIGAVSLRAVALGVATPDRRLFAIAAACVVVVAGTACWIPARRASRVEPAIALRTD